MGSNQKSAGEKPNLTLLGEKGAVAPWLQRRRDRIAWSIAGFDPSSGAGVTADLMTFAAHGLFGCSAITAITVQTTAGVYGWEPLRSELLESTLSHLGDDLPPLGVKIGMLGTPEIAETIAASLSRLSATLGAHRPSAVLDPVLRSSSGRELFPDAGLDVLRQQLLPLVDWITPNWAELAVLSGHTVTDLHSAQRAGHALMNRFPRLHVVVTGGDQNEPVDLLLLPEGGSEVFAGERIETASTHGTGCAFSSALLAQLIGGATPNAAVQQAKGFVEGALRAAPGVGKGRGPMELLWPLMQPHRS